MQMPAKLKNFNIFIDGDTWAGKAAEIELPKLTKQTEDYQGAGMLAPSPVVLGYEAMELTFTAGGLQESILKTFRECGSTRLRFAGAYQRDDNCEVAAAEIVATGKLTELDPGTAKRGDDNEIKITMKLERIEWRVNGSEVLTVDAYDGAAGPGSNAIAAAIGL